VRRALKVLIVVVVIVAGAGALVWAFLAGRSEQAAERERDRPVSAPRRVTRGPAGEVVVTVDRATQTRMGLRVESLRGTALRPEVITYGTLEEDPAQSFTLRAPVAGTLRAARGRDWPRIGTVLSDGVTIGAVEPRMAPVARVDLESRLTGARADAEVAAAGLAAAQAAYWRARELNAAGKIVSDKALEEAEARMKGEQARLEAARANVRLATQSLDASMGPTGPISLSLERGGEVVEVRTQPGEAIESGQPILRVTGFDTLLAKVNVPPGEVIDRRVATAQLVVVGLEERVLAAERVGLAPTDPRTQGQTWLFRVRANGLMLRPGQAVTAYLTAPGGGRTAVVMPRSAVVRFTGKTWVYVALGPDRFTRLEIALEHPTPDGWAVTVGVNPGQAVVVEGAALLLSEELRSQIQVEG